MKLFFKVLGILILIISVWLIIEHHLVSKAFTDEINDPIRSDQYLKYIETNYLCQKVSRIYYHFYDTEGKNPQSTMVDCTEEYKLFGIFGILRDKTVEFSTATGNYEDTFAAWGTHPLGTWLYFFLIDIPNMIEHHQNFE